MFARCSHLPCIVALICHLLTPNNRPDPQHYALGFNPYTSVEWVQNMLAPSWTHPRIPVGL